MKSASFSLLLLISAGTLAAQHTHHGDSAQVIGAADATMSGPMSDAAMLHMQLSPTRKATRQDSVRAMEIAERLRVALKKYADTTVAVADGYKMFMPNVKTQRVFHFTNARRAFLEAFRFDPERPTSLLYRRGANGDLELIGAMYTAPKRVRASRLDERVPLSIARWHKHVNWCVPQLRERERWLERKDGKPLFGPESLIATREACDDVGGRFFASPLGWMIHANVFLGDDLATIWGEHAGHGAGH